MEQNTETTNGIGTIPDAKNSNNNGASLALTASSLKDQAVEQGSALLNQTREVAGQAIDTAKNQVKAQLSTQKDRATGNLDSAVRALEATGQQFRNQELDFVAGYTDNLTNQVRQMTTYLRQNDIEDLGRDVESFARRNPAVFIGGAFLLGVAVARFLKSSDSANAGSNSSLRSTSNFSDYDKNLPATLEDTRAFTGLNNQPQDDVFGARPLTAHNYVPGMPPTGNPSEA